jgi:hypothetical protein
MPETRTGPNQLVPTADGGSTTRGDVPDDLKARYVLKDRGDGLGLDYHIDAAAEFPAFQDRGGDLLTARSHPDIVRDMVAVAQHRGWWSIFARGSDAFRQEAFLTGEAVGLHVFGHKAAARDLQVLEGRFDQPTRRQREADALASSVFYAVDRQARGEATWSRTAETVVKARLEDPELQATVLARVHERIAIWAARGWSFGGEPDREPQPRDRDRGR